MHSNWEKKSFFAKLQTKVQNPEWKEVNVRNYLCTIQTNTNKNDSDSEMEEI